MEANGGSARSTSCFEMAGGEVFDASLAALAPFGRLVTYGIASREPNEVSSGALMRRSRAVVGFWLMHCLGAPRDGRRGAARTCSRASQRGELRVRVGADVPAGGRAPRPRGPARRGARRASSCWTPAPSLTPRHDHLRRPRPLRDRCSHALRDVGYESPEPDPGAGDPAAARGPRRDRPGPDRHRQDRRLRAADDRVRRSRPRTRCRRSCSRRRASCASRSPRRCAPTARARASTSWPCSAARRSAPSRPSCAPGGQVVVGTVGRVLDLISAPLADAARDAASSCSTRPTRCSTSASSRTSRRSSP